MSAINAIITEPLFSLFTGLCGFFFGHRIAIWRDRRKEFNEAAEVFFENLSNERASVGECQIRDITITLLEFDKFSRHLDYQKRKAFAKSVKELKRAIAEYNVERLFIGHNPKNPEMVYRAIDSLVEFTKRK